MMSALVRFAIRFYGVIIGLAVLVLVYGSYSLTQSDLNVFPEFAPTQIVIQTESPGLSASLVEKLVTQPIENIISGAIGVKSLRSQSIPGLSIITVIFQDKSDIYRNRQIVAEHLNMLGNQLPPGIVPNITPLTSSASTVLGLGVTSKKLNLMQLRTLVDWHLTPHLMAVPGVADINVFGGEVRQFQIKIDPQKLMLYQLNVQDVVNAASRATGVRGAGYIQNDNQRIILNSQGQTTTPQQLANITLVRKLGRTIRISDVAEVIEGSAPSISAAAINGVPAVYLSVQGQLGANTYALTKLLEQRLKEIKPSLTSQQVNLHEGLFRPANFIETAIQSLRTDILIGSILVIAVLFVFLFNARTAVISATAIPLSLLSAIVVLYQYGVGLNIMVLGGLAIALGEVVDDAIIDTENIFRRLRENRQLAQPLPISQVVFQASMEVRSSVVYATIIVALVFLPLVTLSGVAGKLFAPLAYAYITAILASLVVALTLTPALCYALLGKARLDNRESPLLHWLKQKYVKVLQQIERRYQLTLITSFVCIALGLALLPLFRSQFIPALHEGHFILHMTTLPGTSEIQSLKLGNQVTKVLLQIPGVKSVAQWVGRAPNAADTFGTHYSEFEVEIGTVSGAEQDRILHDIREELAGELEDDDDDGKVELGFIGATFAINTFLTERIEETISGYAASLVVNIYGQDLDALDKDAQKVANMLGGIRGVRDVMVQSPPETPEIAIRLKQEKLSLWGLHPLDVLDTVKASYEGVPVNHVYMGNRSIGVSVLLNDDNRDDIADMRNIPIFNPEGQMLKLSDVAYIAQEGGRSKILHLGAKRIQTITANIAGRDQEAVLREIQKTLRQKLALHPGNYMEFSGEAEANAQSRQDLIVHSLVAGVAIFLMLYIAFGSLRNLLLTFANLPFALIGGVIATFFAGSWISVGTLVGFVTLFGITLRNSIMMVSHFQHLVDKEDCEWNLETCIRGASERLPSVLMTALVTALGLLPLAIGSGEPGREIEGPMATIIVGGLISSTILNLLILPTIMLHFGKFEKTAVFEATRSSQQ
ncbi:heavy metal efflux pump, CzcA family [Methylophilus rhizosphaerae]|uniref:Heavy metal efflux pump, CzcA family n=1 Tax=Methylophilus rhizosphaerae TaxID=492660 RepID=A0A1G9AV31_9PROT|nr:efflux RND transporter permease subunit [Methylophilus rhizosphaerae]SDK31132.1 heavy metal efflux pump, CzcA family [Methylophilus rhizosphaerae]